MIEKKYTAFFDLDNTILKINSGEALLRRAYRKGLLSFWKLVNAYYLAVLYKLNLLDPSKIIEKLAGWIAKLPILEFDAFCLELVKEDLIPLIHPGIINEMKIHKEKGADLVMLSSAIASICKPLAEHLEMQAVICSELEEHNQHYTGRSKDRFVFRDEKLVRLDQYLKSSDHTRENSYYYADSIDDMPVLKVVGHPVCINPDRRLKKIARKNNWVIHSWD